MTFLILGLLLVFLLAGVPIAFSIGLSCVGFILATGIKPLILIAQVAVTGIDTFVLLAIPMFTLSGYLMEEGGLSKRLADCIEKLFGRLPGSMGTITIISCTFFAALTGSGPATVAAIGAVMMPAMLRNNYTRGEAGALLASGGALGPIIPPSVAMIVYGCTMGLDVGKMFIASVIPGLIMAAAMIFANIVIRKRRRKNTTIRRYSVKEIFLSVKSGIGVLLLPVIVLGGIYGGIFTPTEASVVCVVYSILLGIAYRELTVKRLQSAFSKTLRTSAMVVFIVSMSQIFGQMLTVARIPKTIAAAVLPYLGSETAYLVIMLIILFAFGCFMETLATIVILAPILVPIGLELGLAPLHLGVVFCITLIVGFVTPPFGINLFTATAIAEVNFSDLVKEAIPYIIVLMVLCIIFAFVPGIIEFLPGLIK